MMRKYLLPMAACMAVLSASAFTETPIVTFDYSNISEVPAYVKSSVKASADLNFKEGTSYAWPSYGSSSVDGKGVFVVSGNTGNGQWESGFEKGFSAATLSEKSGSAFCINGNLSGLTDLYPEITAQHSYFAYYGLHWIANASLISALPSDAYVRVRITFNATDADAANKLIDGIVIKKPGGVEVPNSSITGKLYSDVFPDGHSADKWAVYEFDMPKTDNPSYVSFKTPAGQGQKIALLISKVEFIQLSDKADDEAYITTPQITLQEIDNSVVELEDQSSFTFGDVEIRNVAYNLPESTIEGITEANPAVLNQANAFCVPVTVTPDPTYAGYAATYSATVTGVWGIEANNKSSKFTIEVPASEESATGYLEFLPYTNKGTHRVNISGVTYSKEGEDDVTIAIDKEFTLTSSINISLKNLDVDDYLVYTNTKEKNRLDLAVKYTFNIGSTENIGYISYNSTKNSAAEVAEVIVDNTTLYNTQFGLAGYEAATEEYNWSKLAAEAGALPLRFNYVAAGDVFATNIKLVYPFLWGAKMSATPTDDANDVELSVHSAATTAQTATITISDDDVQGATNGIADVAVDANAPVEYFNLQGVRVNNPEIGGIYIRRQGASVSKVAL